MSTPRCHRCDLKIGAKHRCPHGLWCVPWHKADSCRQCRAFKERQMPMFADDKQDTKPFLKWAGGKRQLAPKLLEHMPAYSGRYFEPFAGGAAMFFALQPDLAVLNDNNGRLVRTYRAVRDNVERVIDGLQSYPFDKEFFLQLRRKPVDACAEDSEVACWLIYLNKTAFNGLYRVNKSGMFNVPWGKYKSPTICNESALRRASLMLRRAELMNGDFEEAVSGAQRGDLVYFDPPYVPVSKTSNFTSYTKDKFGLNDQIRLRDCARRLKGRGVHIMVTNSNTPTVRELYEEFQLVRLSARGSVAANHKSRGKRVDLLIM